MSVGADPVDEDKEATGRARERLWQNHSLVVYRVLKRCGVPDRDVEDLRQDILATAYENLSTFRGDSQLRTWIVGIAYGHLVNYRRRKVRRNTYEELTEAFPESQVAVGHVAEHRVMLRELDEKLKGFSDEQRYVFLATLEEVSQDELVRELRRPKGTIGTWVYKVRNVLTGRKGGRDE